MGGVGHLDVDLIRESQLLKLEKLLGHCSTPSPIRPSCDIQLRQDHILPDMTCVSRFFSPFAPRGRSQLAAGRNHLAGGVEHDEDKGRRRQER